MFDFYSVISRNPENLPQSSVRDKLGREFLDGIPYNEFEISGKNFRLFGLEHSYDQGKNYLTKEGITLLLLGDVYLKDEYLKVFGHELKGSLSVDEVLRLFNTQGNEFIKSVKGTFLVLIFDENHENYFVYQSRLGFYFVYYQADTDQLVISTSLKNIQHCSNREATISPLALLQYKVFDYPLEDLTLLKGTYNLKPCNYLVYDLNDIRTEEYLDYREMIDTEGSISWEQLYEQLPDTFNKAVELITIHQPKLCSAITSGFDSRTIMSKLLNLPNKVQYYSWGIKDSFEIKIPEKICKKVKVSYTPVYLDEKFVAKYDYYGKQAVYWSDALAMTSRANHTYGYSNLVSFSNRFITGIIGSELIKPRNCKGYLYTDRFLELLNNRDSNERRKILEAIIDEELEIGFLDREVVLKCKDDFIENGLQYFDQLSYYEQSYRNLYYFFLTEGFRKFFGNEVHGCRIYGTISTPYGDDDFIKLLLSSPIPSLNKEAFKGNIRSSRSGSSTYLPIIEKNYDQLMDLKTGRHFTPRDLKSKFFILKMIMPYLKKRYYRTKKRNQVFDTPRWFNEILSRNKAFLDSKDAFFADEQSSRNLSFTDLQKKVSLKLWIHDYFD